MDTTSADYETLRKLYYGTQSTEYPSRMIKQQAPSFSSVLLDKLALEKTDMTLENERGFLTDESDLDGFTEAISQRSLAVIASLYKKYGSTVYPRVDEMIEAEDFSDWQALEETLEMEQVESLLTPNLVKTSELLKLYSESEALLSEVENEQDSHLLDETEESAEDFAYLNALLSHDYRHLNRATKEEESLSAIFSDILENEPNQSKNYQDDVFNENIALIYNEAVDLDHEQWSQAKQTSALKLDDAIDQLKADVLTVKAKKQTVTSETIKQASLSSFYAQDKAYEVEENHEAKTPLVKKDSWFKRLIAVFKQ